MKRTRNVINKAIAFAIALVMTVLLVQPAVTSLANEEYQGELQDYNQAYFDNYEEAVNASQTATSQIDEAGLNDEGENIDATSDVLKCDSILYAGAYVRSRMVSRESTIYFNFKNTEGYSYSEAYYAIRDEAFKETGNYREGAYLMWNWSGTRVYYVEEEDGSITFRFNVSYLSTASQEKQIDAEVARLLNNEFAGWENLHDYEKVRMVYKWMTSNYKYVEGTSNHSTYSGIINHKTVCQGFATSMYRLLGEMGLNVRVVANDDHGWNIVQLGRYWYSLDATWDVGRSEANWYYFLPAETDFVVSDHYRGAEYDTDEYHEEHPMSWGDAYDYSVERNAVGVDYRTHIQSYGWQRYMYDGAMSGTSGESKRLEGIEIKLANTGEYDLGVEYRTHIQSYGWEKDWKQNGAMSGTSGESKRLEAIQIRLTGADADKFDIYYRVHAQSYGWLGWAKNGQEAGTSGQGRRLEGIQIMVFPKGETPDGLLGLAYMALGSNSTSQDAKAGLVNYRTHVQTFGWQGYVFDGSISGTSGLSRRLEGINISLGDTGYEGGIRYITHVQTYGWQGDKDNPETWKKDGEMAGTSGESRRLEGIRIELYGEVAEHYDVYYRVHAQTFGWLDWASNGADAGTAGLSRRLEAIQIVLLPKGSDVPGSTARPFVTN